MDSNTGYTLTDGRDLSSVFMGINNGVSLATANVFQAKQTCLGGIDLSACPMFYSMPSTVLSGPIYPIGYTLFVQKTETYAAQNTVYSTSITLSNGVWLVTLNFTLTKGSGTYAANSFVQFDVSGNNIKFSPPVPLMRLIIQSGNTNIPTLQLGITPVAIVNTGPTVMYAETLINNTTLNSTSYTIHLGATKIA